MENNPFHKKNFCKDIKPSFVPSKLFIKNEYNSNIVDVSFKLKKKVVHINLKLDNGHKYEDVYILQTNDIVENYNSNDMVIQ